jgi:gas vesicle protein
MKRKNRKEMIDEGNVSGLVAALMFVIGLTLGSLISAVVMLLVAPQSGKKTRRQIRRKGKALRHQASDAVDDTVAQVRAKAQQVSGAIHDQTEALQQRGQEVVDQQKERWAPVVKATEKAVAHNGA